MRTLLLREDQVVVLRYALAITSITLSRAESGLTSEELVKEKDSLHEIKLLLDAAPQSTDSKSSLRAAV
jgi:hypothetical protein